MMLMNEPPKVGHALSASTDCDWIIGLQRTSRLNRYMGAIRSMSELQRHDSGDDQADTQEAHDRGRIIVD